MLKLLLTDFHMENWDEVYPRSISYVNMETIATLYELQAIANGPKLPAQTSNAKTSQNLSSFLSDASHEQQPQVSR